MPLERAPARNGELPILNNGEELALLMLFCSTSLERDSQQKRKVYFFQKLKRTKAGKDQPTFKNHQNNKKNNEPHGNVHSRVSLKM
eukprot:865990-Amphidinium_carterae.1